MGLHSRRLRLRVDMATADEPKSRFRDMVCASHLRETRVGSRCAILALLALGFRALDLGGTTAGRSSNLRPDPTEVVLMSHALAQTPPSATSYYATLCA